MSSSVLVVDDEKNILLTLSQALQLAGYRTELAHTGKMALEVALTRPVDVVLMDVRLPDLDGIAVLEQLLAARPDLPILMMSGHGTIETAVRATRLGARDFLEKAARRPSAPPSRPHEWCGCRQVAPCPQPCCPMRCARRLQAPRSRRH